MLAELKRGSRGEPERENEQERAQQPARIGEGADDGRSERLVVTLAAVGRRGACAAGRHGRALALRGSNRRGRQPELRGAGWRGRLRVRTGRCQQTQRYEGGPDCQENEPAPDHGAISWSASTNSCR